MTIDNLDGRGAVDYSGCLMRGLKITRTLNAPSTVDGTLCLVGLPEVPVSVAPFSVVANRRSLAGSGIGGMKETQEMLDYCAAHGIVSDIEITSIEKLAEAYERVVKADVKYRFVIDMATLKK